MDLFLLLIIGVALSAFTSFAAGLLSGVIGTLLLTNLAGMNYETAFRVCSRSAAAVLCAITVGWAALVATTAGGVIYFIPALVLVSIPLAYWAFWALVTAFAIALVLLITLKVRDRINNNKQP